MDIIRYLKIVRDEEIARRYFVMNSFDGALTILGIIIAVYIAGEQKASLIIISSLGAAVAMAISGIWGAYAIERAERKKSMRELEMHLLTDLDETEIERKLNVTTILVALVDGLSPLLVSLIILSPYFFAQANLMPIEDAFYLSLALITLILFALGMFVGHVAKEDWVRSGINMLLAGCTVGAIVYVLELLRLL